MLQTDSRKALHHFINANVLVLDKSSFGYVAGLYNNNCYCNKHMYFIKTQTKIEICDSILISGKRKGQRCGCKCFKDNKCKRHLKNIE